MLYSQNAVCKWKLSQHLRRITAVGEAIPITRLDGTNSSASATKAQPATRIVYDPAQNIGEAVWLENKISVLYLRHKTGLAFPCQLTSLHDFASSG